MADPNTLTAAEQAAGWKLLFDGKSMDAWRGYQKPASDWKVVEETLAPDPKASGDLITKEQFGSFELAFEWKISAKGNSGVMYHVSEAPERSYYSGPEYQVLDNSRGEPPLQRAGALYDLYAPTVDATKPVGEFNESRLLVKGNHVEHWLNGQKVAEYELGSPEFKAKVAKSKFKDWPFAASPKGHIALQNHGDDVWYRSIKVRVLK
ncbi:DUF1080 domain-containing protein [Phenylobacterium sp.]|uniref:3-keto-disaccharide hydrolase n=1 Tax=Phenylobacterium sp. TaxID=1871053 RepID=UPI002EDA1416